MWWCKRGKHRLCREPYSISLVQILPTEPTVTSNVDRDINPFLTAVLCIETNGWTERKILSYSSLIIFWTDTGLTRLHAKTNRPKIPKNDTDKSFKCRCKATIFKVTILKSLSAKHLRLYSGIISYLNPLDSKLSLEKFCILGNTAKKKHENSSQL